MHRHLVSLSGSPTQCSKLLSETAAEGETNTRARGGKWNFYLYIRFTNYTTHKVSNCQSPPPKFELLNRERGRVNGVLIEQS